MIIPTLNEAQQIGETMARARQSGVEIIVAEGGSEDATVEVARQAGFRVIHSKPGRTYQMNEGARVALGEILVVLGYHLGVPPRILVQLDTGKRK